MNVKKYIPQSLKTQWKAGKRLFMDLVSGKQATYARRQLNPPDLPVQLAVEQRIVKTTSSDQKVLNFRLAATPIEKICIQPQQVFSFWKAVGIPTHRKGYREGRTLVNGELKTSIGGGLCQMAGLLYTLALEAGLEIVERHPHSTDIYTPETRYSPLGADATVVFGYKDFQCKNTLHEPIAFSFQIEDETIRVCLHVKNPPVTQFVEHKTAAQTPRETTIETFVNGKKMTTSVYKRLGSEEGRRSV